MFLNDIKNFSGLKKTAIVKSVKKDSFVSELEKFNRFKLSRVYKQKEKRSFVTNEVTEFKKHANALKRNTGGKYGAISKIKERVSGDEGYSVLLRNIRNFKFVNRTFAIYTGIPSLNKFLLADIRSKNYELQRVFLEGFYIVRKSDIEI